MPQKQCPWCGQLGERYREEDSPIPVGNHKCICRHVTADTRTSAIYHHGKYWDGANFQCAGCGTLVPTEAEMKIVEKWREEDRNL